MAGIYIHIPFCKQACHYCDFHFSTNQLVKDELVLALVREMEIQKDYLHGELIETIYLGGGTPSLLKVEQISFLIESIYKFFSTSSRPEITVEANPDDLSKVLLTELMKAGINRLSIGIQSFDDTVLRFFNRAHTTSQSIKCMECAREVGFDNISVDLIYSIPHQTLAQWEKNIQAALLLQPEHISAYSLTVEEKTVFGRQAKKGLLHPLPEDESVQNFELLIKLLGEAGYWHYEVSNFCKPELYSRHNTNYWRQKKYLGIGPSAHSYDGESRQWNVANNHQYLKAISENRIPFEKETLTLENKINEYLITTLRTMWGCDTHYLKKEYAFDVLELTAFKRLQKSNLLIIEGDSLKLTQKGKLLADQIALDLFVDAS